MIDTCQANTMYTKFYSPNILATGSSQIHENSYSVSPLVIHSCLEFTCRFSMKMTTTSALP